MSFALTEPQLVGGQKDVTRRLRWTALKAGDELVAVRKGMGLRKGELQVVLGTIRIVSASLERLDEITPAECTREGFPHMKPAEFVAFFCKANKCDPNALVRRIEFAFTPAPSPER
jgi:hypothetical protein